MAKIHWWKSFQTLLKTSKSYISIKTVDVWKLFNPKIIKPSKMTEEEEESHMLIVSPDLSDGKIKANKHNLVDGPKRKVALLYAYVGTNYKGLQMNRGDRSLKTIEGDLFRALVRAKLVPENCYEDPKKMSYRSASRTDKGVSTCGQVASLKLIMNENSVQLLNNHLPEEIRALAIKRVTQGFSSQNHASARLYSYTLPTYSFADKYDISDSYKITEDKLKHIDSVLNRYKGTHSYHNFTSGKKMGEDSAKRFIMSFDHSEPFVVDNVEFITLRVKGQSFMIHQIRKMIGLLIALVSKHSSNEHFIRAFSEPLEDVPIAPSTGLLLEEIFYNQYNTKFGHLHGGVLFSDHKEQQTEFLNQKILPAIYSEYISNKVMLLWLDTLAFHDYSGQKAKEEWQKQQLRKIDAETTEEKQLSVSSKDNTSALVDEDKNGYQGLTVFVPSKSKEDLSSEVDSKNGTDSIKDSKPNDSENLGINDCKVINAELYEPNSKRIKSL